MGRGPPVTCCLPACLLPACLLPACLQALCDILNDERLSDEGVKGKPLFLATHVDSLFLPALRQARRCRRRRCQCRYAGL